MWGLDPDHGGDVRLVDPAPVAAQKSSEDARPPRVPRRGLERDDPGGIVAGPRARSPRQVVDTPENFDRGRHVVLRRL